ncbi:alanine--tRNA ligase [Mycoplasmopsis columboralis]|uniref:Alanine--tRNA ligase n=1 Tax=Mycoplasmopsis columboralis TaxID=171282 RepID=A0A449B682_9BACT|nr:alanine--tRNA ligase [Mycoplasmopsis columboralis]VEU76120.1 Alanine--tRNA ligase [Mycoplasmopsis columboralis]
MTSQEIRNKWLSFFEKNNHFVVPSKSLVPQNDPSLLWINSGVATLKDYFSGKKIPPSKRLTNSQKAIRTNDIENVGVTARHHTFFEMLGNFSIGDYFKKEAIAFAVDFLLNELKLDKNRLYFTYYYEDLETKSEWMSHGFAEEQLIPGDKSTNFWEVGSGPCGPNTEIFYDRGQKYDTRGIELLKEDIENDRYIEIWNIVFSTYNSDGEGNYTELNQKNIDTGAGLERIVSILQDAPTNFDTDLFLPIIHKIEEFTSYKYKTSNYFEKDADQTLINTYFKVIADHMRTVVNAINDGAKPSNVGRGYILRRLIRRSVHKGMQLKVSEPLFLHKLVEVIASTLPYEYDVKKIEKIILDEEVAFSKTIDSGRMLLEEHLSDNSKTFPGDVAFKLFETYGFPIELTIEILNERNITVNMHEYEQAKEKHALASKGNKVAGMDKVINSLALIEGKIDKFIGYEVEEGESEILKLLTTEEEVEENEGISYLILKQTPFYATSGGQKHDRGYILQNGNKLKILNVFKDKFGNHIHKVEGKVNSKERVQCFVDKQIRLGLKRNHSGTHLLFCALRHVLGAHIEQLSSDNNEERLTFDFPADEKPSKEIITKIENLVKSYIAKDVKRNYLITTTDKAKAMGAIMTLEEAEYMDPKNIRIVEFETITADLCGGTHLEHSGMLENFKIVSVEKKAAGVFRIRAISSNKIVNEYLNEQVQLLTEQVQKAVDKNKNLDAQYAFVLPQENDLEQQISALEQALETLKEDNKQLIKKQSVNAELNFDELTPTQVQNQSVYLLNVPTSVLKTSVSTLREKQPNALVIGFDDNNMLCIGSKSFNSNLIAQQLFKTFEGRGGGNNLLSMGKCGQTLSKDLIFSELEKIQWEN